MSRMSSCEDINITGKASDLVHQLITENDPFYGLGFGAPAIYDTAWVSVIAKTTDGQTNWLFPEAFEFLINHQQHDGGWQTTTSDEDGILDTLAALLAVCRHITQQYQMWETNEDLENCRARAFYFLETKFTRWSFESKKSDRGFQSKASKLLHLLRGEGIEFTFHSKIFLMTDDLEKRTSYRNFSRLAKSERTLTKLDVSQQSQSKIYGSVMASPALTAEYLMSTSKWDDEAEVYLRHVVFAGHSGGVPTKFPSTILDITSVVTTLLENGFTPNELGISNLRKVGDYLDDCLRVESGVVGSAAYLEPDATNTARAISSLCLLGRNPSSQGLIDRFQTRDYFKTYTQDHNPSFVTNCQVLKAMLDLPSGNADRAASIEILVTFLCNYWWTAVGQVEDPSNASPNYPTMLLAEAFMRLIDMWEVGHLPLPVDAAMRDKVTISLFQALTRLLQTQNANGSWGDGGSEVSAYAVIALVKLSPLSSAPKLKARTAQAIENGRKYLATRSSTAGKSTMHQVYLLAVLRRQAFQDQRMPVIETLFEIPLARVAIQTKYFARHACFVGVPEWLIQASFIESYLLLPQMREIRFAVFPHNTLTVKEPFDLAPVSWLVASKLDCRFVGAEYIYQMVIVSMLARQLEDYMEAVVKKTFAGCLFEVEDIIHNIFHELEHEDKYQCFCDSRGNDTIRASTSSTISDVHAVLYRFISHLLNQPYILMASAQDQERLRLEVLSFLLSRIGHLSTEQESQGATDQTAHSFMYAFLACLVGNQSRGERMGLRRDFLDTPEQQYLTDALCRHISIISFISGNADEPHVPYREPPSATFEHTSWEFDGNQMASDRSVSSMSTSSSFYDDEDSIFPVSSNSSVSTSPMGAPIEGLSKRQPAQRPFENSSSSASESLQKCRLLNHERRCLNFCLEGLLEAGIDQRTNNVIRLFVNAMELSDEIFRDPNVGKTCENEILPASVSEFSKHETPPVPPKNRRGSVAAARAALTIAPLATKTEFHHERKMHNSSERKETPPSTIPSERAVSPMSTNDWSWNKPPSLPTRRSSRAQSEMSRIESIMSEIDGIKLGTEPKVHASSNTSQRRTASESDAHYTQQNDSPNTHKRHPTDTASPVNPETLKLARLRHETQRRLKYEAAKKAAMAEAAAKRRMMNEPHVKAVHEAERRDSVPNLLVKATPPSGAQARKLGRASRLGGPRWKAPF